MNSNETDSQRNGKVVPEKKYQVAVKPFSFKWCLDWGCLLATVFLAGAAINCLFAWCSYGKTCDLAGTAFSVLLAFVSYFNSYGKHRNPSYRLRISVSMVALLGWLFFFPLVMSLAGYR